MYRSNNKVFAPFQSKSPGAQELISKTPGEPTDVTVMRRKLWPLVLLLLTVLAVMVCTLPWVTTVEFTAQGSEVSADGEVLASGTLHIEGRQYNYLFREDRFRVTQLTLPGLNEVQLLTDDCPLWEMTYAPDIYRTHTHMMIDQRTDLVDVYFSAEQDLWLIVTGGRMFTATGQAVSFTGGAIGIWQDLLGGLLPE